MLRHWLFRKSYLHKLVEAHGYARPWMVMFMVVRVVQIAFLLWLLIAVLIPWGLS